MNKENVFSYLDDIKASDELINETLDLTKKMASKRTRKKHASLVIAATLGICIILSVGVVAKTNEDFATWIKTQLGLHNEKKIDVFKVDLPKNIDAIENGFLITNADSKSEKSYCIRNKKIALCQKNSAVSTIKYDNKIYEFSFDYVKNNSQIHAYNFSKSVMDVKKSNKDDIVIVELKTGKLLNSYYYNLKTKEISPVINIPNKITSQTLKNVTSVKESTNGKFILYRSNKDNVYKEDYKGSWYVRNTITKSDVKIKDAASDLRDEDICFMDNHRIYIAYKGEKEIPGIYNCDTNSLKWITNTKGINCGNSMMYYEYENDGFVFNNLKTEKTFKIAADKSWVDCGTIVKQDVICLYNANDKFKVYLPSTNKTLDFDKNTFIDLSEVTDVYSCDIDKAQYLFIGQNKNIGYIMETK